MSFKRKSDGAFENGRFITMSGHLIITDFPGYCLHSQALLK